MWFCKYVGVALQSPHQLNGTGSYRVSDPSRQFMVSEASSRLTCLVWYTPTWVIPWLALFGYWPSNKVLGIVIFYTTVPLLWHIIRPSQFSNAGTATTDLVKKGWEKLTIHGIFIGWKTKSYDQKHQSYNRLLTATIMKITLMCQSLSGQNCRTPATLFKQDHWV